MLGENIHQVKLSTSEYHQSFYYSKDYRSVSAAGVSSPAGRWRRTTGPASMWTTSSKRRTDLRWEPERQRLSWMTLENTFVKNTFLHCLSSYITLIMFPCPLAWVSRFFHLRKYQTKERFSNMVQCGFYCLIFFFFLRNDWMWWNYP